MPHPDILKALDMTPKQWGLLPIEGTERQELKQKALNIIAGQEAPVKRGDDQSRMLMIEQAKLDAEKKDVLTRAGFEDAMVQQARFFGDAVREMREKFKAVEDRVTTIANDLAVYCSTVPDNSQTESILNRLADLETIPHKKGK